MYKKQRLFLFGRQINLYTIKERTNYELFFALKLAIRDFCLEKLCQHTPNATVNKSFLCLLKRYFALHNCLNCLIELEKVEKSSLASLFLRCLQFKEARKQSVAVYTNSLVPGDVSGSRLDGNDPFRLDSDDFSSANCSSVVFR